MTDIRALFLGLLGKPAATPKKRSSIYSGTDQRRHAKWSGAAQDEFYVGQRVLHIKRNHVGTVTAIHDISGLVGGDARDFYLNVLLDGRVANISENGASWRPL